MLRRLATVVLVVASVVVIASSAEGATPRKKLEGPTWVLDQEASNLEAVAPEFVVTAVFADGTVSGSSGCNNYNTTYVAARARLRVTQAIASTLKACSQPAMNVEASYLERLPTARRFSIRGDRLTVQTTTKGADLVYRALSARALRGDWDVTSYFRSGAIVSVLPGTEITATFDAETISGNAGCNDYRAAYEAGETKIEIGAVAVNERACADNAVTQQERDYLEALDRVRSLTLDSTGLTLFRADGGIAVTMTRA